MWKFHISSSPKNRWEQAPQTVPTKGYVRTNEANPPATSWDPKAGAAGNPHRQASSSSVQHDRFA